MITSKNTNTIVIMRLLLLVVPLLFVFSNSPNSIQKSYVEANVIVTPACGPASGFNIKFDATGFSSN